MDTRRSKADQNVSVLQVLARNNVLLIDDADREAREIELIDRIKARHLRRLTADQSSLRLDAAVGNTLDDVRDPLRIVLPARDVVEEEQRLAARACDVVHAHRDAVDTDRIIFVHDKCKLQLRSDAVCAGKKCRMLHALELVHRERAGEAAETSEHFLAHCLLYMLLHELDRLVTGLNIHT